MLQRLEIQNFALIENLEISFQAGFTSVTGETGSGKSVMLSALGLLLGKRADTKVLKSTERKCVVEGEFLIRDYNLQIKNEVIRDEVAGEDILTIRRVILPSGKSRAYVNEEPIKLDDLKALGEQLVDIHSQHQNTLLKDANFAREVVDQFAETDSVLRDYQIAYREWRTAIKEYEAVQEQQEQAKADYDYNQHQLEAFEGIPEDLDLPSLEAEQEMGAHGVEIEQGVQEITLGVNEAEHTLDAVLKVVGNLSSFYEPSESWKLRLESVYLELQEIKREVESKSGSVDLDPERVAYVSDLLAKIYGLLKRYNVSELRGLSEKKQELEQKVSMVEDFDFVLEEKERACATTRTLVLDLGKQLSERRKSQIPLLERKISEQLQFLGMGDAIVQIDVLDSEEEVILPHGLDQLEFNYAAHRNLPLRPLGQIGSGGEMARVMLVLKNILAEKVALPTIIFDEIDTGVSGEIADRVGQMMRGMAENRQVFGITHLPQVAAKGHQQLKVLKEGDEISAYTRIVFLADEDRTVEIAQMISGRDITDSALSQARELLN